METKHTPGKWEVAMVDGGAADDEIVSVSNGCAINIASVFGECEYSEARPNGEDEPCYKVTRAEAKANAALIAQAPALLSERDRLKAISAELVAALELADNHLSLLYPGGVSGDDYICVAVRAALAKAKQTAA